MNQTQINFDSQNESLTRQTPDELPILNEHVIGFDTETDGVDIWRSPAMPVGLCIADSKREWYLPFGHKCGQQYEPAKVRIWAREQLRGKKIRLHQKFDVHMARKWGLDLEEIGCELYDVAHSAALLDDHRRHFDLDTLAKDRLGSGKLDIQGTIHEMPPALVTPYARRDARITYDLGAAYEQDIAAAGLEPLAQLENDLIYCACSMEREGVLLDMPKLERWAEEVETARLARIIRIHDLTGMNINPNSGPSMVALFKNQNIPFVFNEDGNPSFTEEILEYIAKSHPVIHTALEIRNLASLQSRCTDMFREKVEPSGILRYGLHQLRTDDSGTITGRFSSSKVNIQQVMKPSKQALVTKPWLVRELIIAPPGRTWLSSDASQIEYRLFAHYSCVPYPHSTRLIEAYNDNPNIDFHQMVTSDILKDIMIRDLAKNFSFMKLYGGGVEKAMKMTGLGYSETSEALDLYDARFPEAKALLDFCTKLAERRGFVKTFMGRRATFSKGDRFYSALNRILQGTAAELMKMALLALYRHRKQLELTMRLTMHDEIGGDVPSPRHGAAVEKLLNEQRMDLRVPILWDVKTARNWSLKS